MDPRLLPPEHVLRLGASLRDAGRHAAAIEAYRQAIASGLEHAQVYNDLGNALVEVGDLAGAAQAYDAALACDPRLAEGHFNLASLLQKRGEVERAAEHYREAIRARADFFDAHFNLGYLMLHKGDATAALDCYASSVALRPELPEAHFNCALLLLLKGDFARGWQEYEWRWRTADATAKPVFREPEWDGSPLQGRTILLYGEQGFGDAIQFARYAALLAAQGAKVFLRVPQQLKFLLETVPGVAGCVIPGAPMPRFDVHFPLLSLPKVLETDLASIPAPISYVGVDEGIARKWTAQGDASLRKLKVGLAWAAQSANRSSKWRSCPFEIFAQLTMVEGVAFYSLQKAEAGGGPDTRIAKSGIVDRTSELADFADTAALVANLDLVVTVDTAVAHLAGALGKPVWTLLPFAADWRWLERREDSPWYPTMRLFRQKEAGDWAGLIARVASELARVAASHSGGGDADRAAAEKNLGNEQRTQGSLEQAADSYRRSLLLSPDYVPSLYNLGLTLNDLSRFDEAEVCFHRVVELQPGDDEAWFHLGALLHRRRSFDRAERAYRRALEHSPTNANLWIALAAVIREDPGRLEEAAGYARRSIEVAPDLAEAHFSLALLLAKLDRRSDAKASFMQALELDPAHAGARNALGNQLQQEGALEEAIQEYREAIRADPQDSDGYNNLGCALTRSGALEEAADALRSAIRLKPDFADAHLNLGGVLGLLGRRDQTLQCFQRAYDLRPDDPAAVSNLLFEKQNLCDWAGLEYLIERRRRAVLDNPHAVVPPFQFLAAGATPAEQLAVAKTFAAQFSRAAVAGRALPVSGARRGSRLRIGYLSADFHDHVTAYVMAEVFELHDRGRFETYAYSYGPDDNSPMRSRLLRSFQKFVDLRERSHREAAEVIRADAVDILVDLKGYTQFARSEIIAYRPAPITAAHIGYPGTLAAEFIDYLVADRYVIPAEQEKNYGESLVFLPDTYFVSDSKRAVAQTPARVALGLPDKAFVFCCFNQAYKILPNVFGAWMRILAAVPDSVLWLLDTEPAAKENLRREAARLGIAPERLIFAPRLRSSEHLARVPAADLFLDTRPYNAHTTACDALWMGVPVLTCSGDTFASRVAGSLLTALGVPELIAATPEDYEARAVELARMPAHLTSLREKISRRRREGALFDTARYTRNLERAYEGMWARYSAGEQPATFDV